MHQQPASAPPALSQIRPLPDVFAIIGIALGIVDLVSLVLLPILWPLTLAGIISGLASSLLRRRSRWH